MEKEGTHQGGPKTAGIVSSDSDSHRLYFKGLVREDTRGFLAGFGVAICDKDDKLVFQMKGSLHYSPITVLEVELKALKRGLTEAVSLGITHISICCDHNQIFELVLGRSVPEKDSIRLLMEDVERIRQQLTCSNPVLVTGNQTQIAYKLAMETLVSEISISMPPPADLHKRKTCCSDDDHKKRKESCGICFEDGLEAEHMFYVAVCRHQFCVECMKRHLRLCLLIGRSLTCPHDGCNSKLTIKSCANLLEPKLRTVWEERNKDDSEKIKSWLECKKCQNMTGFDYDDSQVTCSCCGYSFCYECGVEWHGCPHDRRNDHTGLWFCLIGFLLCIGLFLISLSSVRK
ncbi:unnamed protein product [Microthlaspi erraticum]|uniref:RBR-type E3 ubiquitin transferase n=1 Tax=Microthlaspi erraticum TaxID=1685480 RepID=A0A6D2KPC6_9BRAS|nr:unnamed protein product [Microthlaspi erraticum]